MHNTMAYNIQYKDKDGNPLYPVTLLSLVTDASGESAEQKLIKVDSALTKATRMIDTLNGGKAVAGSIDNKLYLAIKTGQLE